MTTKTARQAKEAGNKKPVSATRATYTDSRTRWTTDRGLRRRDGAPARRPVRAGVTERPPAVSTGQAWLSGRLRENHG